MIQDDDNDDEMQVVFVQYDCNWSSDSLGQTLF